MAKISLNDFGRQAGREVRLAFGSADFTLEGDSTYETDDANVIASASVHPLLNVTVEVAKQGVVERDENDPQVNPQADHLVAGARPDVIERADKNQDRIRHEIDPLDPNFKILWPGTEVTGSTEAVAPTQPPVETTEAATTEVTV